jgi:hypothetical protein
MATRLKTVHYAFPTLASLTNNTLTNLTQITIFLPETGTKTFRSVVAHVTFDDIITNTGGSLSTKTLNFRLGAAAYTSISNTGTLTHSSENASFHLSQDYTSHFTTNWTGTSMTADFQLQINQSTGTTTGFVNVSVTLEITYEYDDTSTTQIKSVMIPLNAPTGALTTGAVTYDTFPALDTYLPETSKTYRNMFIVVQGNEHRNALTTDHTITINLGASTVTTGNYEGALASDRWFRYVWNLTAAGFTATNATQNFQLSATVARCNHLQCYAVITYEYDESTSTSIMNSVMLPLDIAAPFGGTTSADYQRGQRDLFIQEPGTITTKKIAFFPFWIQSAAIAGLNMRIGTGSFVSYTDTASVLCGTNGAMVRNDSAFTLIQGRNTLNFDVYRTSTTDFGWNVSGFWLINYTSDKHTSGSGAHNHTVFWGLQQNGTANAASNYTIAATSIVIPETSYYITAIGTRMITLLSATATGATYTIAGMAIAVEKLAVEGGIEWENVYTDLMQTDPEVGTFYVWAQSRSIFKRWSNDPDSERIDVETNRRWRVNIPQPAAAFNSGWISLSQIFTYHTITYTVSGTVSGSSGGTVTLNLCRENTGERVLSTTRSGNGSYSFTWYDDTENVFVEARESGTLLGRSDNGVAV